MSSVSIQFCMQKRSTHSKCVGVFARTSLNLSKHAGFQTIQSRAKETRQTGPGVVLFQQEMSDLKGKRGFAGNLHTQDFESFLGRLWAIPPAADGPSYLCLDGLRSHIFFQRFSVIISHL